MVLRRSLYTPSSRRLPSHRALQSSRSSTKGSSSLGDLKDASTKLGESIHVSLTTTTAAIRRVHMVPALACPLITALSELDRLAKCEGAVLVTRQTRLRLMSHEDVAATPPELNDLLHRLKKVQKKARRALRMVARAAQLLLTFAPLAALYPVAKILKSLGIGTEKDREELAKALDGSTKPDDSGVAEWYLSLCLWCVESSGAAVIKLMQWASSRPDMFGERFCEVFGKLQDSTTPHAWRHTEKVLRKAYGEEWNDRIQLGKVLGSGCIGQVYAGSVKDANGEERDVAVKVMHPGVKNNIDADLDLLAFFANGAEHAPFGIGKQLHWLDLPGVVDEFHRLLLHQLDFRTEADNLVRFNENFKDDEEVLFPQLIPGFEAKEEILVETFCDGIPFWQWNEENIENVELRKKMCNVGIRTGEYESNPILSARALL